MAWCTYVIEGAEASKVSCDAVQGASKKTEFCGYAGRDGCDGPMEGGRGLKKLYLIFIYKYTNTICSNTQTHSNTPTNTV